jgi:hypothetical protein
MLNGLINSHLSAAELSQLDLSSQEGLASLTAILAQALQSGLSAGEAAREEEARKAAEERSKEKKRKREEAKARVISPQALEKKRRRELRDEIRK